jgi:hypothetical protein
LVGDRVPVVPPPVIDAVAKVLPRASPAEHRQDAIDVMPEVPQDVRRRISRLHRGFCFDLIAEFRPYDVFGGVF